jgi:protein ImuB
VFACLSLPASAAEAPGVEPDALEAVARAFSPRVEVHAPRLVTLDVSGLGRLLGTPANIGRELVRDARERGCAADVALAGSRTAAMLLALACDGLTVVPPGEEAGTLASLPLGVLARLPRGGGPSTGPGPSGPRAAGHETKNSSNRSINRSSGDSLPILALFRRWGLRTLGDVAALPSAALSERIGQDGLRWQRVARGEDLEPLVAMPLEAPIEEALDLDWPVEGLEPLSFLLPRLLEPICERLERLDQAAVGLDLSFHLATRQQEARRIPLPAPMRDARVLRTLVLLHLESHPLGAGVDRIGIRVDTAPARIVQFSLLARALPFPEQMATLLARLGALMGERRVGAPVVVDSHRPGAFTMEAFSVAGKAEGGRRKAEGGRRKAEGGRRKAEGGGREAEVLAPPPASRLPSVPLVLRRFRLPVAARVIEQNGRPVRVTTERRGLEGGRVEASAGPWRTSGEWWKVGGAMGRRAAESNGPCPERGRRAAESNGWNRDEWDVALSDGAVYRVHRDRATERWFVEGILD